MKIYAKILRFLKLDQRVNMTSLHWKYELKYMCTCIPVYTCKWKKTCFISYSQSSLFSNFNRDILSTLEITAAGFLYMRQPTMTSSRLCSIYWSMEQRLMTVVGSIVVGSHPSLMLPAVATWKWWSCWFQKEQMC